MEIVETLLDTTSISNNRTAVYNWLNTYYSDYFDTIEQDTSNVILLKINNILKLKVEISNGNGGSAYLYSTTTTQTSDAIIVEQMELLDKAYKTDNGLFLLNSTNGRGIVVAKDNNNNTFCAAFGRTGNNWLIGFTNAVSERIMFTTQGFGSRINRWTQRKGGNNYEQFITQKAMLEPLMTYEGAYTPNLFLTPYSQYTGTVGIITIDGVDYVYNGYCALKG